MELLQIMVCRSKVWKNLKLRRIFDDLSSYVHCSESFPTVMTTIMTSYIIMTEETRIKSKELEGRKVKMEFIIIHYYIIGCVHCFR